MDTVTDDQITTIAQSFSRILQPSNPDRRTQQIQILSFRDQHPNQLVLILLHILQRPFAQPIRTLSAIVLRQISSTLSSLRGRVWKMLQETTKELVKSELLKISRAEHNPSLRRILSEQISDLALTVFTGEPTSPWSDFIPFLLQSLQSQDPSHNISGLQIIGSLFYGQLSKLPEEILHSALSRHLESQDLEVKVSAMQALVYIFEALDTKSFNNLLPGLLRYTIILIGLHEGKAQDILKRIRDMADVNPQIFQTPLIVQFVSHVFASNIQSLYLKFIALDLIVTIAERQEKVYKEQVEISNGICTRIFNMMVNIDPQVDEEWQTPPEGFQEAENEGIDIDYAIAGRKLLLRMLQSIGAQTLMPNLLQLVQVSLDPSVIQWQVRNAALMTLAQLSRFIEQDSKILEILQILTAHSQPTGHPKLRFAVLACVSKLCTTHQQDFQNTYHSLALPLIVAGLEDPVQRVVAEACYTFRKFIQNSGRTLALQYAQWVFPKLQQRMMQNNCSLVIQAAISAVQQYARAIKSDFSVFLPSAVEVLTRISHNYTLEAHKKVRGKAIKCLSQIFRSVGKQSFDQYALEIIGLMKNIHESLPSQDSIQEYLLQAWQAISATLGVDFVHYITEIVPSLLKILSQQAVASISTMKSTEMKIETLLVTEKGSSIETPQLQNKEIALETILNIVEVLEGAYAPYVQETWTVVQPLINFRANEKIRSQSASVSAALVSSLKHSHHPAALESCIALSRTMLSLIWQAAASEFDQDTLTAQLTAIKYIIESPGQQFLTQQEVNQQGEFLIKILDKSLNKRSKSKVLQKAIAKDDQHQFLIGFLHSNAQDSLHTAVSEVLGSLFKTHRRASLQIVEFLYNNVLSKFLQPNSDTNDKKFAIFVIDDIIEFVGHELVGNKWSALAEALIKFSIHQNDSIRQAAVYGLGILASCTSHEVFAPWAGHFLSVLNQALGVPKVNNSLSFQTARDNAIASLGKAIKYQSSNIDLGLIVPEWILLLPIKHDKPQAKISHEILSDLCLSSPELVIGPQRQRLPHLLDLFSKILQSKTISPQTPPKIKSFIQHLQSQNFPETSQIFSSLPQLQQDKLSKLFNQAFSVAYRA